MTCRFDSRGRRGLGGTHFVLWTGRRRSKSTSATTVYLAEQKIVIAKGDAVEVLDSTVTIDEERVLARRIKKGTDTWTLRDTSDARCGVVGGGKPIVQGVGDAQ